MNHPMHQRVVALINEAVALMDDLLRDRIEIDRYAAELRKLNVDDVLVAYKEDFKKDATLVYYLDALMLLSSLQHEIEFQVAEYGANVALEDMRSLQELMTKFPSS
ncbi:MAG: hypothetical protein AB1733_14620 [Thermodesulfobacteriota bacterium]